MHISLNPSSRFEFFYEVGLRTFVLSVIVFFVIFFPTIQRYIEVKQVEAEKIYHHLGVLTLRTLDPNYKEP